MDVRWFDEQSGVLALDEHVAEMPAFQKIMADGVVTDEEILEHAQRVAALLKRLDEELPPPLKGLVTEVLSQLAALHALQRHREVQRLGHSG